MTPAVFAGSQPDPLAEKPVEMLGAAQAAELRNLFHAVIGIDQEMPRG